MKAYDKIFALMQEEYDDEILFAAISRLDTDHSPVTFTNERFYVVEPTASTM